MSDQFEKFSSSFQSIGDHLSIVLAQHLTVWVAIQTVFRRFDPLLLILILLIFMLLVVVVMLLLLLPPMHLLLTGPVLLLAAG